MKVLAILAFLAVCSTTYALDSCNKRSNGSCSHCVDDFDCFYCGANKNSTDKYPCMKRKSYSLEADCSGTYYLYPSCSISGLAVMILVIVFCLLFVIIVGVTIYCCCCRSGKKARLRWEREDEHDRQARSERRERQDARRAERKARHDDIRKKYGLYKDDQGADGRYQRFDV